MISAATSGAVWLFSLHVLAAFAVGAPVTALLVATAAGASAEPKRALALGGLVRVSAAVFRVGVGATLLLGLWLVFTSDAYSLLDGWVIAALLLWLAIGGLGDAAISRLKRAAGGAVDTSSAPHVRRILWLEVGAATATIAEFAVMLWRPGA